MKIFKKLFSVFFITSLIFTIFTYTAFAASCSVSVSSTSGKKGDTVSVNVRMTQVDLGSCTVNVNYDTSKLQFVSASVGAAGSSFRHNSATKVANKPSEIRFSGSITDANNITVSGTLMTIKFKILASSGSASLTASGVTYNAAYNKISTNYTSGKITINSDSTTPITPTTAAPVKPTTTAQAKSSDATLKSLTVKGVMDSGYTTSVALSPSFSSSRTSYNANIAGDVVKLSINAVPNNSSAKVSIPAGYLRMDPGSNVTKITVTAEDGTKKVYTINTKKESSGISVTEPITGEIYTQALTEPSVETTTETDSTTQLDINESVSQSEQQISSTSADMQNQVETSRNNMYIKLGIVFGAAAAITLITAIVLFVKEGKKGKGDRQ